MAQMTTRGVDIAKHGVCVHGGAIQKHVIVKSRLALPKALPYTREHVPSSRS